MIKMTSKARSFGTPALAAIAASMALTAAPALADETGAGEQAAAPAYQQLAVEPLARGDRQRAIAILEAQLAEHPDDPALLINLGIAQAQRGNSDAARASFEAAMASPDVVDLETAGGSLIDSRRLARRALAMLERGEFAMRERGEGRLSMRQ